MSAPTARELLDKINEYDGATGASLYELTIRVEKVLALHYVDRNGRTCIECVHDWPCPTVRALNGEEA